MPNQKTKYLQYFYGYLAYKFYQYFMIKNQTAIIHALLEEKYKQFSNQSFFIETDPVQIPHRFKKKEDVEIAGFIAATLAWGQRVTIIKNATTFMRLMDDDPHCFLLNHQESDLKPFDKFVHRTFNSTDAITFINSLKEIYRSHGGLETAFAGPQDFGTKIHEFKKLFFSFTHLPRTTKHIADPLKGSAAKRLCMYLRWMTRPMNSGSDLGVWTQIAPAELYIPLDVHSGRVARKLGLLTRDKDDWKSVVELTAELRKFDPIDPCKYDYALFGLGAFDKF